MLIGNVLDPNRDQSLQSIISEIARKHVSRYPIEVVSRTEVIVEFVDPRLSESNDVAILSKCDSEKGGSHYLIESHQIKNHQYSPHSDGYNSCKTTDLRKARKILSGGLLQPLTPKDIVRRSISALKGCVDNWREQSTNAMRNAISNHAWYGGVDRDVIMRDIIAYRQGGSPFTTGVLAALSSDVYVNAYKENYERHNTPFPLTHIFINPDGVVNVATLENVTNPIAQRDIDKFAAYNTINEVPQEILSQYAVLKIVDNSTVLKDVGVRAGDNNFWVYQPLRSSVL